MLTEQHFRRLRYAVWKLQEQVSIETRLAGMSQGWMGVDMVMVQYRAASPKASTFDPTLNYYDSLGGAFRLAD